MNQHKAVKNPGIDPGFFLPCKLAPLFGNGNGIVKKLLPQADIADMIGPSDLPFE